ELVAEFRQADPCRHGEGAEMISEVGLLGRNEVRERLAVVALVLLGLLPKEVETLEHAGASAVRVKLDVVADGVRWKKSIDTARPNELLLDDHVQESVGFPEELSRLLSVFLVLEDPREHSLQFPGVKERCPVDEVTEGGERKIVEHPHAGEFGLGDVL